ncbi:hypothetical protein [Streptomyces violascens]|uniref:hypothetical protein n=1 Tax=Streptomyces violascens TaxID=67381 RepID=UPI00367EC41C
MITPTATAGPLSRCIPSGHEALAHITSCLRDFGLLWLGDDIVVGLRTLTARPGDVVFDRTRQIDRPRAQLVEVFQGWGVPCA